MGNKRRIYGLLVIVVALVVGFFILGLKNDKPQVRKRRKSPLYMGLQVKTIHSESTLSFKNKKIVIPPVLQGDMIEHEIVVKNWLAGPLQLKKMKSCCGFMLKNYSRQIQQNGTGKISLLVVTDKFGGKTVKGTINAETNDKKLPVLTIDVSLAVEKFADISRFTINLKGAKTDELTGSTTVSPIAKYPFKIKGLKPKKGYFFDYAYTALVKGKRTEYLITVKNKVKKPVIYRDVLFVQTDHPNRPELKIRVDGKITD